MNYVYAILDDTDVCVSFDIRGQLLDNPPSNYVLLGQTDTYEQYLYMRYNRDNGTWVAVTWYFYAMLDEENIVHDIYRSESNSEGAADLILLSGVTTVEQAETYRNKMYKASTGTFVTPPTLSTDGVYRGDNKEQSLTSDLEAIETALENKAPTDHNHNGVYAPAAHTHTATDITEDTTHKFMTSEEKTKLQGVSEGANNYVHPLYHSASMINETGDRKFMTPEERTKLNGIATGANNYTHPTTHSVSMITETDDKKVMTAAERTKLAGIATGANEYTHPATHPASMITGLPTSLPANGGNADKVDGKHASDFASSGHTHTAAEVGALATTVLELLGIGTNGTAQISINTGSTDNVLERLKALGGGFHTAYSAKGVAGNPNALTSFRFFCHFTGEDANGNGNNGWCMGFSTAGGVYECVISGGAWQGWHVLYEKNPGALWTGKVYMTDNHTVTPTKKLSECQHGWLLLWSDYDADTNTANDYDYCTTMISKRKADNALWSGQKFLCHIPSFASEASPYTVTTDMIKSIKVYDEKLVGNAINSMGGRNDVVLRAVYEF